MATELWDLYGVSRVPLGRTHPRGDKLNAGEYHIVVEVWTVNSGGNILLTLRSPEKDMYPNKWECTGGSALAGETSVEAAKRELFEETGITASAEELTLIGTDTEDFVFFDIYILRRDVRLSELVMQPGETVDAKWVTMAEIDAMVADNTLAEPLGVRFKRLRAMFAAPLRTSGA